MKRFHLLLAVALVAAASPIATWLFFKPLRVIAPGLNGVYCSGDICVEDRATFAAAAELHRAALANIAVKLNALAAPPRVIFCATQKCYRSFGGRGRGIAVFDLGVVIAPDSWQPYLVEHELIHMLQSQELGLLGRERSPLWFKEGMAFHVSAPPDFDLPDYARPWVAQYRDWERQVGRENVWSEIGRHQP